MNIYVVHSGYPSIKTSFLISNIVSEFLVFSFLPKYKFPKEMAVI